MLASIAVGEVSSNVNSYNTSIKNSYKGGICTCKRADSAFFVFGENSMKKSFLILTAVFCCLLPLYAKKAVMPEWVQNYRTVFPNSEYLAQRGIGDSAEKARTDATAALSRYFKTSVNANLSTTMTSVTAANSAEEKTLVVDDVNVQSEVELFALEYTEPFYYKAEKKWYCVVYMNRNDAWQQYKPQIEIKKNSFNGLYSNLEAEKDYFEKAKMCGKVWQSATELLEKLEYGRIINPIEEASYQGERDKISKVPVIFEESKQNCSIYIQTQNDYNRLAESAVSSALADCGLNVSKNIEQSNYIAEVLIELNASGSEPVSVKPGLELKIQNKEEKTVYSCEVQAVEKSVAYTLENAQKKAFPKLAKEIEEAVKKDLSGFLKL